MNKIASPKSRIKPRQHTSGFTLIELLVVIVIISIVTAASLLALRPLLQNKQIETAAKQLAVTIPIAQQQAILQAAVLGLKISAHGYQFYRFVISTDNQHGSWHLITHDRVLVNQQLATISFRLTTTAENPLPVNNSQQPPQIIFSPGGDMSAFTLLIGKPTGAALFSLTGKTNGTITLSPFTTS